MGVFSPKSGSLVVIGNFDGVHLGHRAVLTEASAVAAKLGLAMTVLTFEPHPALVLGRGAPATLTSVLRKTELLQQVAPGIHVEVYPFDEAVAALSPGEFAERILRDKLRARVVLVGENFRFGKGRSGDFETLVSLGERLDFEARALSLVGDGQGAFSSTRIRALLCDGQVRQAGELLSRPHRLTGVVEKGDQRGRTLGFPTANLGEVMQLLPADGVYATHVSSADGEYLGKGALNIGSRPTVDRPHAVEVHVIGVPQVPAVPQIPAVPQVIPTSGEWYGRRLRVDLVERIRPVVKFASLDDLRRQIEQDIREVCAVLERAGGGHGT